MNSVLATLAICGAIGTLGYSLNRRKRWRQHLTLIASEYGLVFVPGGLIGRAKVTGSIKGAQICIDSYSSNQGRSSKTWSRIKVSKSIDARIVIKREGTLSSVTKLFTGEDVQVGIPFFDNTMLLRGPAAQILGSLDSNARDVVLAATGKDVIVEEGHATYAAEGYIKEYFELENMLHV